jgi:dihydroorotate dehydrogenase
MYQYLRPLLFKLPPESAHELTLLLIGLVGNIPPLNKFVASLFQPRTATPVDLFGLHFPNHVGLAAGYDKNAEAISGLASLSFGHLEIGTVTPLPQTGNPKPRIFRLPQDQAIINRMGFPSKGAAYILRQIRKQRSLHTVLGVNIGKNKDTPLLNAAQDYITLVMQFAPYTDYLAINISSPNTIGLRELQHSHYLQDLLQAICEARTSRAQALNKQIPLLVKLSPDMHAPSLDKSLQVILDNPIEGIIATNTTVTRKNLSSPYSSQTGGLSGAPLTHLSTEVIAHIHRQTAGKIPIIAVGGILSPQDAQKKLDAGASLIQLYTGLVYKGPSLIRDVIEYLSESSI